MSGRAPHYIRPAQHTSIPRSHLILDVETRIEQTAHGHRQTFRLACGELLKGDGRRGWSEPERRHWSAPVSLWADVLDQARPGRRLIVWCHNLAFDLRASGALRYLPAFGFELEQIALDYGAAWARFTRESASVMFCDTLTWLPASLQKIAQDIGRPQVPKPDGGAEDSAWRERCERDVEITRLAVCELMGLIEAEDLGPFRPTGAGQSHSAWRRRHLTHRPLVHDDLGLLGLERQAQWTGRCEAWRWGELAGGPYHEYDLDLAYCQIAHDSLLPCVHVGPQPFSEPADLLRLGAGHTVLARIEVQTDVPVLPAEHDGRILWPVGRFETTVWAPELELALEYCSHVEVIEAHVYRTAPVLKGMAGWIIAELEGQDADVSPIKRRLLKHWARAMVGRLALRYRTWEDWAHVEEPDISLGLMKDWDTGRVTDVLQLGNKIQVLGETEEAPDSLPQIPGYIVSECRRRLWRLMLTAGLEHVAYVDTDALIVDRAGAERLERTAGEARLWPLHLKGSYRRLEIFGPRSLIVDERRRMAGVPLRAGTGGDGRLHGQVFLSLRESLMRGQAEEVHTLERSYGPTGADLRRSHEPAGETLPYRLPVHQAPQGAEREALTA